MKLIKYFLLMSVMLFLHGCPERYSDEPNIYLNFVNKSGTKIHIVYSMTDNTISSCEFISPPTESIANDATLKLPSHTDFFIDKRKLGILLYEDETLKNYTWSDICNKNIFDKQYLLTLEELKAKNYTIIYDGK